jgi:hypothetical protein
MDYEVLLERDHSLKIHIEHEFQFFDFDFHCLYLIRIQRAEVSISDKDIAHQLEKSSTVAKTHERPSIREFNE